MNDTVIRCARPNSLVSNWLSFEGQTLLEAAKACFQELKWELAGNIEGFHLSSVQLIVPVEPVWSRDDQYARAVRTRNPVQPEGHTRRIAELVVTSTGSTGPNTLTEPGEPRTVRLEVTVPAITPAGVIDLLK